MGVISRHMKKEANQRVAAARVLEVRLGGQGLEPVIGSLIERWNQAADATFELRQSGKGRMAKWANNNVAGSTRHYSLIPQRCYLLVVYGISAQRVIDKPFNANNHAWLADINPLGVEASSTRISVSLRRWSVNDSGLIWNGASYVQMLDGLVEGLDGRYISQPVDPEDCHFVSYA